MKIKLKLELDSKHRNILPLSNRYETSAWIYKTLNRSDTQFSAWLHDHGYRTKDGKANFKLFSFSDFGVPRKKNVGDRMIVQSNYLFLEVSFYINADGAKFIMGLFKERNGEIGDQLNTIKFKVAEVSNEPSPEITQKMQYRSKSPIVISRPVMQAERLRKKYIAPQEADYKERFIANLIRKADTQSIEVNKEQIDLNLSEKQFSSLITIAKGTQKETKVKGFKYYFDLTAPKEIHELILSSSVGELGSQGFGFVEVVD
ncbi:MAG: CRISPR-associated endoribonuclease Cas6 [Marinifilaceae bacterium]|jgi:CRISPR-associated endoribonuclease Cas6|nr:CRISPR-associated endoribonuclease Cas6 [Marinifilaceae bacterium]